MDTQDEAALRGSAGIGATSGARPREAVKKSQLEEHFTLTAEDGDKGGRWTITLPGVDPPPFEERDDGPPEPRDQGPGTPLGRLIGKICVWDQGKGFGFLKCEEVKEGDVYFRRMRRAPGSGLPRDPRMVWLPKRLNSGLRLVSRSRRCVSRPRARASSVSARVDPPPYILSVS